ncbi:MAG: winged helix-turn-helix transcriptional regulator [Candidatus Falkowbacteria bacterium]|jgi:DNA-binding transcriptional ArsR family regulator|uniref:ArsR family transcriptional regulator n=1 Tax=Candidatus Magasanikbacteria bacterium CG10_big_fil_rev_8_21_14_0_10_40_10 TaxID=1974648 RepID=A0A2M6W3K9_9BACT|nr:MAG: ArsR family transcriptional regulator [Candidatus Magasanikbacteria bacterium CG10_big_fil_rev_8_21_14_0_10_40_10]QQG52612.1 MAG: winged helix-turn-helix transcriptional regulator [Candidatus Falkowbacteria bacterium]
MSLNNTFAALADPNRQKIIKCLKKSELPVSEIAKSVNITLATLSHHLDILRRAGLVSSRREGRQIFYELNMSVAEEIMEGLAKMFKK